MTHRSRYALLGLIMAMPALTAPAQAAQTPAQTSGQTSVGWITVRTTQQAPVLSGFAAVQPGAAVTITALQAGLLTSLSAMPGETMKPGQTIGQLGGPQVTAALATAQGARNAAAAAWVEVLSKFADHLATKAALARAAAAMASARANLAAVRAATSLQSPVAGQVQSLAAGPGAMLRPGQAVAVVQPATGAWVRAVLYSGQAAALPPGLAARFSPADGAPAVPVTLRGVQALRPDGGVVLAFSGAALRPGVVGTLSLFLAPRPVLLVPSEALVLDGGRWWVMLHDARGDHAARVEPGVAEGAQTPILSGLATGDQVIVQDAALLYHRDIAAQYQPPD